MNPVLLEDVAAQHMADIRDAAARTREHVARDRVRPQSRRVRYLRARAGWTLVDLGLRLAAPQPLPRIPRPRPAGS